MKTYHFLLIVTCFLFAFSACQHTETLDEIKSEAGPAVTPATEANKKGSNLGPDNNPNNNPCDHDELDLRILFIGSSHTDNYTVDLASMVEDLALFNGQSISAITSSAVNGYSLTQHLNYSPTINLINSGNWDYVILQPATNTLLNGSTAGFNSTVNSYVNLLSTASPNAKIVLYEVVPQEFHTSNDFASQLVTFNNKCATVASNYPNVFVCNIAQAFANAYAGQFGYVVTNPDVLRFGSAYYYHFNNPGSFLTAVSFYAAIFQNKPCIPGSMTFYLPNGTFGNGNTTTYAPDRHRLAQIAYMNSQYAIHTTVSEECRYSFGVGDYPCY